MDEGFVVKIIVTNSFRSKVDSLKMKSTTPFMVYSITYTIVGPIIGYISGHQGLIITHYTEYDI